MAAALNVWLEKAGELLLAPVSMSCGEFPTWRLSNFHGGERLWHSSYSPSILGGCTLYMSLENAMPTVLLRSPKTGRLTPSLSSSVQDAMYLTYFVSKGNEEEQKVSEQNGHPWISYAAVAAVALLSGLGYLASGQWVEGESGSAKAGVAVLRTLFTFAPALVAFFVATRQQRKAEERMAAQLSKLRSQLNQYVRLQAVQNELHTVERLAKVARSAVRQTGNSSNELFSAISYVTEPHAKERLVERFRHHADGLVTVLTAVNEEMSESGRKIYEGITADQPMNIMDRADYNSEKGLEYAETMIKKRGIQDGVKQLQSSVEQARVVQAQLNSTTSELNKLGRMSSSATMNVIEETK
ncbi:MAG TPA: hypothetical protein VEK08_23890 [Planctomycetota bacterium]|nr:hypothetical protein [Planctomycetota bacterium]